MLFRPKLIAMSLGRCNDYRRREIAARLARIVALAHLRSRRQAADDPFEYSDIVTTTALVARPAA